MRLSQRPWLIVGLLVGLSWADEITADLSVWDIDSSCTAYSPGWISGLFTAKVDQTQFLQESFDDALVVAVAANESLHYVLEKRLDEKTHPDEHIKWNRIAESMAVVLGFWPNADKIESPTDTYWKDVIGTFTTTIKALSGTEIYYPFNVETPYHRNLVPHPPEEKTMVQCGLQSWKWLNLYDFVPVGKGKTRLSKFPFAKDHMDSGSVGAWWLNDRLVYKNVGRGEMPFCPADARASVNYGYNTVSFCNPSFATKEKQRPRLSTVKSKKTVKEFDKINTQRETLGFAVLHEMMHWFGGTTWTKGPKSFNGAFHPIIDDQTAVNSDGQLLYQPLYKAPEGFDTAPEPKVIRKKQLSRIGAYAAHYVYDLAKTHTGATKDNAGPAKAITNADSMAIFGVMMYLDDWNWAFEAKAHVPGKSYDGRGSDNTPEH